MIKMTQTEFAAIKRDIKRQMQEVQAAFDRKDWEFLDQAALQLSASAINLHSESRAEAN